MKNKMVKCDSFLEAGLEGHLDSSRVKISWKTKRICPKFD